MNLEPKLRELEAIYVELEKKMADPEIVSDIKEMQELSKKHSELDEVVNDYRRYKQTQAEIAEDLGVSQMTISRVEKKIKEKFAAEMAK